MQQRYYDPLIGEHFLSVDPVTAYSPGGAFNQYWYANANPYGLIDPDGRDPGDPPNNHSPGPFDCPGCDRPPPPPPQDNKPSRRERSEQRHREQIEALGGSVTFFSLPGTRAGSEAAQYWADQQAQTGNVAYAIPGVMASLWTPETSIDTALTLGGGAVGRPVGFVASWAGDAMVTSRLLGPGGRIFGNTFYAGRQGILNYGTVRLGWSFNAKSKELEFAIRFGKEHFKIFSGSPP